MTSRFRFGAAVVLTPLFFPGVTAAQAPQPGCDPRAIAWALPGQFAAARERARSEHRFLLIKGVAFGIDEAGATCATKGRW